MNFLRAFPGIGFQMLLYQHKLNFLWAFQSNVLQYATTLAHEFSLSSYFQLLFYTVLLIYLPSDLHFSSFGIPIQPSCESFWNSIWKYFPPSPTPTLNVDSLISYEYILNVLHFAYVNPTSFFLKILNVRNYASHFTHFYRKQGSLYQKFCRFEMSLDFWLSYSQVLFRLWFIWYVVFFHHSRIYVYLVGAENQNKELYILFCQEI